MYETVGFCAVDYKFCELLFQPFISDSVFIENTPDPVFSLIHHATYTDKMFWQNSILSPGKAVYRQTIVVYKIEVGERQHAS
jgi:hypothetical protein